MGSVYGRPDGTYLTRADKHALITEAYAYNKIHREPGQHVGPLTRATISVLRALLYQFHNNRSGDCFPSYERIAAAAPCSVSTVGRAISALRAAGLLDWHRCFTKRRVPPDRQWKVLRTSNAYTFAVLNTQNKPGTTNQVDSRVLAGVMHILSTTLSTRERRQRDGVP